MAAREKLSKKEKDDVKRLVRATALALARDKEAIGTIYCATLLFPLVEKLSKVRAYRKYGATRCKTVIGNEVDKIIREKKLNLTALHKKIIVKAALKALLSVEKTVSKNKGRK